MTQAEDPVVPAGVPGSGEAPTRPPGDVRRLAARAALVVGARGLVVRLLGFAGLTVLARYLHPRDLGVIAVGLSLAGSIGFFTDAGIAAGLIREKEEPDPRDLRAVMAFQLIVTVPLAVVGNLVALALGHDAQVVALMLFAVPLVAFRTPGTVMLERRLDYGLLARIEVLETLAFTIASSVSVIAGAGALGVAGALILRSVVGTGVMVARGPLGLLVPRWSWRRLRPLLRFGAAFQAIGVIALGRDQGVNLGVIAVAGAATLGIWSVASRLMQVPILFFEALWRVSYPAVARLLEEDQDARGILQRAVLQMVPLAGALLVTMTGAAAALVPLLFGSAFAGAADAIPFAALGLLVSGPISVCGAGYLWAAGRPRVVVSAMAVNALLWVAVAVPTSVALGAAGVGVGSMVGAIAEGIILGRATAVSRGELLRGTLPGILLAVPSGAVGWWAAKAVGPTIVGSAAGAAAALAAYALLMMLFRRKQSTSAVGLVTRTILDRGPIGEQP